MPNPSTVTVQKELQGGWTIQTGYVGTHVVHQYTEYNLNYGQFGGGTASEPLYKYGITPGLSPVRSSGFGYI